MCRGAVVLLLALGQCTALSTEANPIRKIVTLMQNMQKEIEVEHGKQKELFDKFMCYCNAGTGELNRSIEEMKAKIVALTAKAESESAEKTQTEQELAGHKSDREGATHDLQTATNLRSKEQAEYESESADLQTNIASLKGAIPALEKGMSAASFVQLPYVDNIRKLVQALTSVDADDRRQVTAFLDQNAGSDYAPQSGQIVGILKNMNDELTANLKESVSAENQAVAAFADLKASKQREIDLASQAIETKTARAGELAVTVVQNKDGLKDTEEEQADAEKFVANLNGQCGIKQKAWAETQQMTNDEVAAISQAISILNDDDALDVFKKTMPSVLVQSPVGFLQRKDSRSSWMQKARALLATSASKDSSPRYKVLLYTLNSQLRSKAHVTQKGFEQVSKILDDMIANLHKEEADDQKQLDWCKEEFNKNDDEDKAAMAHKEGVEAKIQEQNDSLAQLVDEISNLNQEVKDLDQTVAEATEQRKEEHVDYTAALRMNQVAQELVDKAKNRLNKFYQPTLYRAAPATTTPGPLDNPYGFLQVVHQRSHITLHGEVSQAPDGPAPFKKSGKSTGVIDLMNTILRDLANEGKDMQYEEKAAQQEYNKIMGSSKASREATSKGIVNDEVVKAEMETKLNTLKTNHRAALEDISLITRYNRDLHVSCDFLMQNFDMKKEARAAELETLQGAKATLAGANLETPPAAAAAPEA